MGHPGEQFYPQGVHWDDPLPRGALKAGARIVHLSLLDGEIALSHKLSDSGARERGGSHCFVGTA